MVSWSTWCARLSRAGLVAVVAGGMLVAAAPQLRVAAYAGNAPVGFTGVDPGFSGSSGYPAGGSCLNGNPDDPRNCNIYAAKTDVFLNASAVASSLRDGSYFFAVLQPGGQADPNDGAAKNLADTTAAPDVSGATNSDGSTVPSGDAYSNRTFTVSNGSVAYSGSHDFDAANNKIRLMPYDDTPNNGDVYVMAVCSLADGYPVAPSTCKYDNFKVSASAPPPATPLTVTKDAAGGYTDTYAWTVSKSVDKTLVEQFGGTATFNYTVAATHDGGTISNITVTGTIKVFDPNLQSDETTTAPVAISSVTDQLSDGTNCSVTNSGAQVVTQAQTQFPYSCSLSSLPAGQLDNTASVAWPRQLLSNGALLEAGSADFVFQDIAFTPTSVDACASVTDSVGGTLGSPCVSDTSNPTSYTYANTVNVPAANCQFVPNTATLTASDTGASTTASKTVEVCGPARTGALTIGFWQNKNGQGIVSSGASTLGVCNSGTWLRQYAPFADLGSSSTCSQVAAYVSKVIKAATCSGTTQPCNAMLKAQMLATALDTYFSDASLGGNKIGAPAPLGAVVIDLTAICRTIDGSSTASCSGTFQNTTAAFGSTPSLQSVASLLNGAAGQSNTGGSSWYSNIKATQILAKDTFDAINNQVAFAP